MSESEKCFSFLHDIIPSWLDALRDIGQKIEDKHDEIAKVPVRVVRKTGSTESIRPGKEIHNQVNNASDDTNDTSYSPHHPEHDGCEIPNQATRQQSANQRKRKTASVLSKTSGPSKYRTRSMIVVYYDSEVQKAFENLVRNIGTGRNILRKGKMAARMEAVTAAANTHDDDDHGLDDPDDDHYDPVLAKVGSRPRGGIGAVRTTRAMGSGAHFDNDRQAESYDAADVALEKAQTLCERGAHQSLRDGDCHTELAGARENFEQVLQICQKEVQRMEERKVLKKQRQREAQEKRRKQEEESMQDSATGSIEIVHHPALQHHPSDMMVADIEVDDDSDDGQYALPTLPPMRSTRMMGRV